MNTKLKGDIAEQAVVLEALKKGSVSQDLLNIGKDGIY